MNIKSALRILQKGMTTELWGRRFYEQALAHTADATGQRVFRTLMDEEIKHLEILRGQYAAISGGKGWVSVEEATTLAASVTPTDIFPEAGAAERLVPLGATDEQALRLAMDFERRGYDLYKAEGDKATAGQEKGLWEFLAKAEDMHYAFLDKTLEFLKTNGTWYFDEREFPFFET
ncbi:MAG: ferritin family protein [Chloroflexi bacterium]|jgi:rubrerythrin|nr:ferritin family protein [Chloroflexota bacterium]